MRLVEDAAQRRAPIVRLADRVAAVFVPVILALAAGVAATWWFIRPEAAFDNAAALLITTCPCALGLATPLAVIVGIGKGARRGVLVKGGDTLEALARSRAGVMVLDKTGTITHGGVEVVRFTGPDEALTLAAALESRTSHAVARAIVRAAGGPADHTVADVSHRLGAGISGTVDGRRVSVGSPSFILDDRAELPPMLREALDEAERLGLSPVVIALDAEPCAVAAMGDRVREDSRHAIAMLRSQGWRVCLLSGDHPSVTAAVGAQVGIGAEDCRGAVSPEAKLAEIRRLVEENPGRTIVMVGDGVNDAAALAAATVGVAVHGGAEASMDAAGVYLARPGLAPLVELTTGARRTLAVIRRNMVFSLLYNALFITLAATGVLTPLIAAVVMPFSSLTVVLSSTRTRAFGDRP